MPKQSSSSRGACRTRKPQVGSQHWKPPVPADRSRRPQSKGKPLYAPQKRCYRSPKRFAMLSPPLGFLRRPSSRIVSPPQDYHVLSMMKREWLENEVFAKGILVKKLPTSCRFEGLQCLERSNGARRPFSGVYGKTLVHANNLLPAYSSCSGRTLGEIHSQLHRKAAKAYPSLDTKSKGTSESGATRASFPLTHLAARVHLLNDPTIFFRKAHRNSYHASHLCHNRMCFRPSHITIESQADNCRRSRGKTACDLKGRDQKYDVWEDDGTQEGRIVERGCSHGDEERGIPFCLLPRRERGM